MTRDEKIAQAQRLASEGLINAEIGRRLGVTDGCVWKWLHPERVAEGARAYNARPERRAKKRAWERAPANRGDCQRCEGKMGSGRRWDGVCASCRAELSRQRRAEFVRLRREGLTNVAIGDHFGLPAGTVATEIYRAKRRDGLDVPGPPNGLGRPRRDLARQAA